MFLAKICFFAGGSLNIRASAFAIAVPPFLPLYSQVSWCMGYIADNARRFFHPAAINEMLSTFVPLIDGTKLDVSNCTLALDRILT